MREKFKGFYDITADVEKDIFQSNKTLFVLDTNCFLNLYRCEEETKNDFIAVVNNIKDRLWFPFQVCLEYQRNRLGVISSSLSDLDEIKKELKLTTDKINNYCSGSNNIKRKYHNLHAELCELKNNIDAQLESFISKNIESRKNKIDFIANSDDIRKWVDSISEGKISISFLQKEIDEINKQGDRRYKNKIGPGWKDEKEKKDEEFYFDSVFYKSKYGDLYLWNELLKKAKDENIDNIIFITNDVKEDWWYKVHGKTIGSLENLKTEIINAGLKQFKMYTQPSFLLKTRDLLKEVEVKEASIEEFERLNKSDFIEHNKEDCNSDSSFKYKKLAYYNENNELCDFNDKYKPHFNMFYIEKKLDELYGKYELYNDYMNEFILEDRFDEAYQMQTEIEYIQSEIESFNMLKSKYLK
ncbi:TPA: hypothetical protein SMT72_001374 [Proteus mirabilis]|uniref:PIN-like domain-containing protein n=2 Tax=Proteus mirabilis TaxID=584 RepID=UPI001BD51783|nr:PIN-like domain-containing protein [Proteus mirabilis]ELA6787645.1 hypothetical protein [Proteus mirabilis]ELB1539150.1 hypothetical protein [Proteus mirabilis]ELT8661658.1 hypothetical protein [Proteus mirabilis]EMD9368505.1 hypothetical protein [Proteus mirabilis]MCU9596627.1 PIN-like domain-containing protein [Proteus mirabilis]